MRRHGLLFSLPLGVLLAAPGCGGDGPYSGGGGMTEPPPSPTLTSLQSSIFTPRCAVAGCHVGAGAQEGMDLSAGQTHSNVVNVSSHQLPQFLRVEPGDPSDSYLYMKLAGDPRILNQRMPFGGPYLSDEELEAVAAWILAGAADD